MTDNLYTATHTEGYNGPGYLNICAMQRMPKAVPEVSTDFRSSAFYDVYQNGVKVISNLGRKECITILDVCEDWFTCAVRGEKKGTTAIKTRKTVTEYTFSDLTTTFSLYGSKAVKEMFGCIRGTEPAQAARRGKEFRGYEVHIRYVVIDCLTEEVVCDIT